MFVRLLILSSSLLLAGNAIAAEAGDDEVAVKPKPRTYPGSWLTPEDYPEWAAALEVEGTVQFALSVDETGKVVGCDITQSSGVPDLDTLACSKLIARGSFLPARDAKGNAIPAKWKSAVRWVVPQVRPAPPEQLVDISFVVERDGSTSQCGLARSEGGNPKEKIAANVKNLCGKLPTFKPILDDKGNAVRKRVHVISQIVHEDLPD